MTMHLVFFLIIILTVCSGFSATQALHTKKEGGKQYLHNSVRIGAGFDSIRGEFKKNCIVKINSPITFEFSDKKNFELLSIDRLIDLTKALELPTTSILPVTPHPLFKEKHYFLKSLTFNRFNHFLLAKVKVTSYEKNIGDSILKEKYIGYLKENGINQFTERCGNSFLSKYAIGSEHFLLFEFMSRDEEEHNKLQSLFGSFENYKFNQDDFFQVLSSLQNLKIKRVYINNQNETLTLNTPSSKQLNLILSQMKSRLMKEEGQPHSFLYTPYHGIIDGQSRHPNKDSLETILSYHAANQETLNDLDYIHSHPHEFKQDKVKTKMSEWTSQAGYNLSHLSRLFSQCLNTLNSCLEPKQKYAFNPIPKSLVIKHTEANKPELNSCTTTVYKLGKGKKCGVASYIEKRMPYCGVARYQKAPNKLCPGSIRPLGPKILKKGALSFTPLDRYTRKALDTECQKKFGDDWIYSDLNPVQHGPLQASLKIEGQKGYHTCIRLAKIASCRHPSHGVEAYKKCQHPSHGVDEFKQCRRPEFGVQYRLPRSCLAR